MTLKINIQEISFFLLFLMSLPPPRGTPLGGGAGGAGYPVTLKLFLEISHIPLIVQPRISKLHVEYPHISF